MLCCKGVTLDPVHLLAETSGDRNFAEVVSRVRCSRCGEPPAARLPLRRASPGQRRHAARLGDRVGVGAIVEGCAADARSMQIWLVAIMLFAMATKYCTRCECRQCRTWRRGHAIVNHMSAISRLHKSVHVQSTVLYDTRLLSVNERSGSHATFEC